ncbi:hypothetical protein A5697_03785 [Mycobacterium sp. E3251]|uniref:hypothetical protein n=1 Tax=unclassified Mycobacterium TaxID=2642494 RepID=UPI0008021496|nr:MULTISPECIES: hypothetical protein [unclassified Mycobacterium]OBG93809.1 hypothetical protein A5697_03785 [Mycobacterium sp. E3251]OBI35650.1 hypothetical protein A5711_15755 [Mycobacterium sp. E2238]
MHKTVPVYRNTFARELWYGTGVRVARPKGALALRLGTTMPDYAVALLDEHEPFGNWSAAAKGEVARGKAFLRIFKQRIAAGSLGARVSWLRFLPSVGGGTTWFDFFAMRLPALCPGRPLSSVSRQKLSVLGVKVVSVGHGMGSILLAAWKRRREAAWFPLPVVYTISDLLPFEIAERRYGRPVYAWSLVGAEFMSRHLRVAWRRRVL